MNCKGNELAMIKVQEGGTGTEHNGKIVFITALNPVYAPIGNFWDYEGTLSVSDGRVYQAIADECLRPLGNPGEDEVDETLLWKKVPDYVKPKELVTTED